MRSIPKIFFILLFVVSFFIPLSAFGSEISVQFKAVLEELPQELASPFAKVGVESIVFQFFRARVEFEPNQYESRSEFRGTFVKSFDAFRVLLHSADLRAVKEKVSAKDIVVMENSYLKQEKLFAYFSNNLTKKVNFFRQIPSNEILKAQMYFSLLLSGFNREQWLSSRKFTHIWPFCD
jgi:hypothetical protein